MNSLSVSNTYLRNLCCASPVHKNSVTLVGHLQQRGLHPHAYLDDWLMWYQSSQKLNVKQQYIIKHTLRFWFLVNWEKSSFNPETRFSRCFYRSGKWHDFSCLRTLPKFERYDLSYTNIRKNPSQNILKVIWNMELLHRFSALGKIAHEAH